jgi:hypothetical protein
MLVINVALAFARMSLAMHVFVGTTKRSLYHACFTWNIMLSVPVESTRSKQSIQSNFLLHISILISRRYIVQWMTLPIPFHYFVCKGYLLANYKDKCLALSPGTSCGSSNTPYIFAWITWVVKKYYMIHSSEVNSPRCSVTSCKQWLICKTQA